MSSHDLITGSIEIGITTGPRGQAAGRHPVANVLNQFGMRCKPECVVFDIGGVLALIDKTPLIKLCESKKIRTSAFFDKDFVRLQTGKMTPQKFLMNKSSLLGVSLASITEAFSHMIKVGPHQHLLQELTTPYLFASNINALHFAIFSSNLPHGKWYRKSVLSYEVGYLKPHPNFFARLLDTLHNQHSSTVFIDDKPENLEFSASIGLIPVYCQKPADLQAVLQNLRLI